MVKSILYEGTIALGTSMDSRKDLWRSDPRDDSGGSGWRKEAWGHDAGFIISWKKTPMVLPVSDHHASVCIQCVCVCCCYSFLSPYVVCLQLRLKKIGMQNWRQTPIHKHTVRCATYLLMSARCHGPVWSFIEMAGRLEIATVPKWTMASLSH